jgi:hypothetical protein
MECWPVGLRSFFCAEYSRGKDYRLVTDSFKNRVEGAGWRAQGEREKGKVKQKRGKTRIGGWRDRLKNKKKGI